MDAFLQLVKYENIQPFLELQTQESTYYLIFLNSFKKVGMLMYNYYFASYLIFNGILLLCTMLTISGIVKYIDNF